MNDEFFHTSHIGHPLSLVILSVDDRVFESIRVMRPLDQLINLKEPAWPEVLDWIRGATVSVEVLPTTPAAGSQALYATQVTSRSPMGAIVLNSAGIFIDHGWLRVLGSGGHLRFKRSLPDWNAERSDRFYLIADDAIGGFFAMNGGAFGSDLGHLYYFAPDSLDWEPLNYNYSEFIVWSLSGKLHAYYEPYRWDGWESEIEPLTGDQLMGVYPFLSTENTPIAERHRSPVPVAERYALQFDLKQQLEQ